MRGRRNESSHQVYMLDTMNNVLGILILSLILALVVDSANRQIKTGPDSELASLQKRLDAAVKELALPADQLTSSAADARERVARELATNTAQLAEELARLLNASGAKEQQLQDADARIASAIDALSHLRSKADLEEDLARAESALRALKEQKQALLQQMKEAKDKTGEAREALDFGRGRVATSRWEPKQVLTFVCRSRKLCRFDDTALGQQFQQVAAQIVAERQKAGGRVTIEELVGRVNEASIATNTFSLRIKGLSNNGNPVGWTVMLRPRYGDEWQSIDRLRAPDSDFARQLAGADPASTGIVFNVWGDSFALYVEAVSIAKKLGFRTSWMPYAWNEEFDQELIPGNHDPGPRGAQFDPKVN